MRIQNWSSASPGTRNEEPICEKRTPNLNCPRRTLLGFRAGQTVVLRQEFDQALFEGIEIRAKFARRPGIDAAATRDHADLAAQAANLLGVVTAEEGCDLIFHRQAPEEIPHCAFGNAASDKEDADQRSNRDTSAR